MGYPEAWNTDPPEIPPKGERVPNNVSQFASEIRKQIQEGRTVLPSFANWLYDYEALHPPPGGRTYLKISEEGQSFKRTIEAGAQPTTPGAEGAQVAVAEGRRLDRVLEAMAEGIDKLGAGIQKLSSGFEIVLEKLIDGNDKIVEGHQQLQADHRSLLGIIFPQTQSLLQGSNDTMVKFREAALAEAKAKVAVGEATRGDGSTGEAEKAIVGMLTEVAKTKMLEVMSDKPKAAAAPQSTQETK